MECYCALREKPIRHQKTEVQPAIIMVKCGFWSLSSCSELYLDYSVNNWSVRIKSKYSSFSRFTIHETLLLKKNQPSFEFQNQGTKICIVNFWQLKKKESHESCNKNNIFFWYPTTSHDNSFLTITHTFRTINITKVT